LTSLLTFALLSLACYRLARFVAYDDAPGDVMLNIRTAAGSYRYNDRGQLEGFWAKLLACPYCSGLWIALPLAYVAVGWSLQLPLYWLAIAGAQAAIQGVTE
jgi:hypothetical protein